jgi:hypothetical protein
LIFTFTVSSQGLNSYQQCNANIELLRGNLLSMLKKIPAMPPIGDVYIAAKERYEALKKMRDNMEINSCLVESERVLRITKPYGRR